MSGFYTANNRRICFGDLSVWHFPLFSYVFLINRLIFRSVCRKTERSDSVDEKKRAKIIKVCRIIALILAVLMVLGVIFQPLFR